MLPGPNAEPDYFTPDDIATFYSSPYSVHYNSCAPRVSTIVALCHFTVRVSGGLAAWCLPAPRTRGSTLLPAGAGLQRP